MCSVIHNRRRVAPLESGNGERSSADGSVRAGSRQLGDSPHDFWKGVLLVAEAEVGVGQGSGFLLRVDRDVGDLGRLKDSFQELPARLVARLLEESSALEPDMTLAGEADRDVHGWHENSSLFRFATVGLGEGGGFLALPAAAVRGRLRGLSCRIEGTGPG